MLSTDHIIDINVSMAAPSSGLANIDTALIVGSSGVIGESERIRVYSGIEEMEKDGFTSENPEYTFAKTYFGGRKNKIKLAVGVWISADGTEKPLDAVKACAAMNSAWEFFAVLGIDESDMETLAKWASETEGCVYIAPTSDTNVLEDGTTDIAYLLKVAAYKRAFVYYTKYSDADVAALMGYLMDKHNDESVGAFDLAYKNIPGASVSSLTEKQMETLMGKNANAYVSVYDHNMIQMGKTSDGTPIDELLGMDQLLANIRRSCIDYLATKKNKIPQTDMGVAEIVAIIESACQRSYEYGFFATGTWNGGDNSEVSDGDIIENGYLVRAGRIVDQTVEERRARKTPPIAVYLKLAGAIESIVIYISVNR